MTDFAFETRAATGEPAETGVLSSRLAALPTSDRRLVLAFAVAAFAPLLLGLAAGTATAAARAGLLALDPEAAYRLLTVHGTSAFFWWLYFAQAALALALAAGESERGFAKRSFAAAGLFVLLAGMALSEATAWTATPLLYDANPDIGREDPSAVAGMAAGYLLLGAGLVLTSLTAIATVLDARDRETGGMTAMAFGVLAWAAS